MPRSLDPAAAESGLDRGGHLPQSAVPDDVNGLLIAALTGLVARQSAVAAKSCCSCPSMRCQTERASWLVSEMQWHSGHAD